MAFVEKRLAVLEGPLEGPPPPGTSVRLAGGAEPQRAAGPSVGPVSVMGRWSSPQRVRLLRAGASSRR